MRVAFIGLGNLGSQLYIRLSQYIPDIVGYDLNLSGIKQQKPDANLVSTLAELELDKVDCLFTCLPDSGKVKSVYQEICGLESSGSSFNSSSFNGSVWIDCTSGNPGIDREIADKLSENGVHFIDCAVSGGPHGALQGTVTSMVGCNDQLIYQQVKPMIALFSKEIYHLGPVGSGHAVKAVNNSLLATNLCVVAEGMAKLKELGVDLEKACQALSNSSGKSKVTESRYPDFILKNNYNYGFSLALLLKDLRTCLTIEPESERTEHSVLKSVEAMIERLDGEGEDNLGKLDHLEIVRLFHDENLLNN